MRGRHPSENGPVIQEAGQLVRLDVRVATSVTSTAWLSFFADLVARGLTEVRLATSDAHHDWVEVITANMSGASRTQDSANLMSVGPKSIWQAIKAMLHSVHDQSDTHKHLDATLAYILAITEFPAGLWAQIRSNNPNERFNREIRRRTDSVGIFPNLNSIIRLVGAVLAEQTDEWAEGRHYLGLDIPAKCRLTLVQNPELRR